MATAKVSPLSSHAQFTRKLDRRDLATEPFAFEHGSSLYIAVIQQPARKWEKPYRHQREIALFAKSPEELKLRLRTEDRLKTGEKLLQIMRAGE